MNRKRTILVIAVIALLAVAIYGGQALAAKPSGSPVAIETGSYSLSVSGSTDYLDINYPQVRHISLTVRAHGFGDDMEQVIISFKMPSGTGPHVDVIESYKWMTYEFNADYFHIIANEVGGNNTVEVECFITTTYPR